VKIGYLILAFCLVSFVPAVFAGSKSSLLTEKKAEVSSFEKVFVKTDKNVYWNGERLFYKAWILDAQTLKTTSSSNWLYFELINVNGKCCMSWKVDVSMGEVSGITSINDTIQSGVYVLRAFTNLMRNMPERYYYSTNILVLKLSSPELAKLEVPINPENEQNSLICRPSGGQLIDGVNNTVFFNFNNTSKSFNAQIIDDKDTIVSNFVIDSTGIGSISFVPSIGREYYVCINDPLIGKIKSKPMNVFQHGFVGSVNHCGNKTCFSYSTNEATLKNDKYAFTVSIRDKKLIDTSLVVKGTDSLNFNLKGLAGIVQVVITNSKKDTVFEQLYYCSPQPSIPQIEVSQSQNSDKIEVQLNLAGNTFSDTVNMALYVSLETPFSILNTNQSLTKYIYVQSEVGLSFNAFNSDSSGDDKLESLLALVNGDNYYWNLVRNRTIKYNQRFFSAESKGFYFTAQLIDGFTHQPISGKKITLSYVDSIPNIQYAVTDTFGYCHFLLNSDAENKELIIQMPKVKDDNHVYSLIVEPKGGSKSSFKKNLVLLNTEQIKFIEKSRNLRLVEKIFSNQDIKSSDNQAKEFQENFRMNISNMIKYTVFPQDYTDLENMVDIINNILPGVFLKESENSESLFIFDLTSRSMLSNQASVFVNGVLVDDLDFVLKLNYAEIYKIDVCQTQLFYGDLSLNGFISIVTKEYTIPSSFFSSTRIKVENLVAQSQLVNKYDKKEIEQMQKDGIPDFRNVLYIDYSKMTFNPGKSNQISIYPSNLKGLYNFNIQGFAKDGRIIENSVQYKIQ
jgi:hypothetical protein